MPEEKKRELWPDVVRGLCMIVVVFIHARLFAMAAVDEVPQWALILNGAIAPFCLPSLFAAAGYFVPLSLKRGVWNFIWVKLLTIGWPLLLWNAFNTWRGMDITSTEEWLRVSYLWFLAYLLVYSIIAALTHKIPPAIMLVVSMLVLTYAEAPDWVGRGLSYAPYFFAGMILSSFRGKITTWARSWWAWLLVAGGLGACYISAVADTISPPRIQYLAFLGIAGTIVLAVRLAATRASGPLQWIGQHSLEIYVLHWPLGYALSPIWPQIGSIATTYLLMSIVIFALTCLAARLFRLPILRRAFSLR